MSHYPHFHRRSDDPPEAHFERVPQGMSEEQLKFFTEQTERAVEIGTKRGVRAYRNNAVVGFLMLLVGIIIAVSLAVKNGEEGRNAIVKSGRVVSVDGCNRDYQDREKFRDLLQRLKVASAASPTATDAQKKLALEFYDDQLKAYPSLDCRKAETVVTADPNSLPAAPEPCFKGNPNNPPACQPPLATRPGG